MEKISHSVAHYLLVIHQLKEKRGYARITDIARELGLTKGSVSTTINKLKKRGLIVEEEGVKFLQLTEKGHEMVHSILVSRSLIYHFLAKELAVDKEVALTDACAMEHLLSLETQQALFFFLKGKWKALDKYDDFAAFLQQQSADFSGQGVEDDLK